MQGEKDAGIGFSTYICIVIIHSISISQMATMNIFDFGRQNKNCHVMGEGFVLWEITGNENETPVFLKGEGSNIHVHVLVLAGEIKIEWKGRLYPLTKNCFADFMDSPSLEIRDISEEARAYIMLFTAPFIASLMKNTAPFPPSYVLRIKARPVSVMSSGAIGIIQKRMNSMVEIFSDETHHFYAEMMSCMLRIYTMDMANEFIRQVDENSAHAEAGRKHILFKQLVGLLLAHIREEHSVSWYASQLCVTPQYLNRVIKSISQKTVYEHICIVLTNSIIERLENTEDPISQIAEDFHFPDLATMTKFFKRQTGKTPTEYRKVAR